MLMGQFSNGGVTLHIPDGDAQNDTKAAHDETLQTVDCGSNSTAHSVPYSRVGRTMEVKTRSLV